MKLIIIESPYAGDIERNMQYLNLCILDAIKRRESPYASHIMLTSALNDADPVERSVGIEVGFAWHEKADYTVAYIDYGISDGMRYGIDNTISLGKEVIYREILK